MSTHRRLHGSGMVRAEGVVGIAADLVTILRDIPIP